MSEWLSEDVDLTYDIRAITSDLVGNANAPLAIGTGYVAPVVMLEFGARSTGEPSELRAIRCDGCPALSCRKHPFENSRSVRSDPRKFSIGQKPVAYQMAYRGFT